MAARTPISPAVEFDPVKTSPVLRPAFQAVAADPEFLECDTLRDQVLFPHDFLLNQVSTLLPVTYVEISRLFKLNNDAIVGDIIRRGHNGHKFKGRIPTLDEDDLEAIRRWLDESLVEHSPLTLLDVVRKLARFNRKTITTNALQKALKRYEIAKTITAFPEEAGRLLLKHSEETRYIAEASTLINDVNAAFVFNMDESGVNDLANATPKKVLVDFHSNETSTK